MQPLSLLALYEGYVTVYRGWERRGSIPLTRLQQLERHHAHVGLFLEQQQTQPLPAQAFGPEHATRFYAWLLDTQHYPPVRAVQHLRRVQRVLWWGLERGYVSGNPLAGFRYRDLPHALYHLPAN